MKKKYRIVFSSDNLIKSAKSLLQIRRWFIWFTLEAFDDNHMAYEYLRELEAGREFYDVKNDRKFIDYKEYTKIAMKKAEEEHSKEIMKHLDTISKLMRDSAETKKEAFESKEQIKKLTKENEKLRVELNGYKYSHPITSLEDTF